MGFPFSHGVLLLSLLIMGARAFASRRRCSVPTAARAPTAAKRVETACTFLYVACQAARAIYLQPCAE